MRIGRLLLIRPTACGPLVQKSYDRISGGYDQAWTGHMQDLTAALIDQLNPQQGEHAADLTCGTGFAADLLAEKTGGRVIGVDRSAGMLDRARANYGNCEFVQADMLDYLKQQPASGFDVITCCWGLGYSRPFAVLRQIKRVLRPGGRVAIIDNTLFSLREVLYCSFLAFSEQPDKLVNLMRFRFLTGPGLLSVYFRLLRLRPLYSDGGSRTYYVASGQEAIERLKATGAAAGFEYAAEPEDQELIFRRFAEILEAKYKTADGVPITHRYLAGIAQK